MPIETSLRHHNHQFMASHDARKGIILVKHFFMCHFVRIEAICTMYPHFIETDLYTLSLGTMLHKCVVFTIFEFLMNTKTDFHISLR